MQKEELDKTVDELKWVALANAHGIAARDPWLEFIVRKRRRVNNLDGACVQILTNAGALNARLNNVQPHCRNITQQPKK